MRVARAALWLPLVALVVLGARGLCYALVSGPRSVELRDEVAGPGLPVVAATSLVVALALAAAVVWLASLAVRERHLLSGEAGPPPRLRLGGVLRSALALWVASSLAFAGMESYVHLRAGLGLHGVTCLGGPVHRNAVPVLAALSLLSAAFRAAAAHVLAWERRTIRLLLARRAPRIRRPAVPLPPLVTTLLSALPPLPLGARGPPAIATA
jgi:hypothetical protein